MPPDMRKAHPHFVYNAIQAQPELIEKILLRRGAIERTADAVAQKERITFVGIGTSLHAARVAESWMREFSSGRLLTHAEESFELVHHPIAITGEMSGEGVRSADFQIETCEQEVAFAYTKSYTTALAALAILSVRIVERRKLLAKGYSHDELAQVPALIREALRLEPQARELAKRVSLLTRIEIFGTGVGWATASEAALT